MFDSLLIHPKTSKAIDSFLANPSHALLLVGKRGMGKPTLGLHISASLLGVEVEKLDNHPHFRHIKREKGKKDIPIEAIRNINKSLRLQVPGQQKIKRVILVEDANYLNTEAQNAFLKSLEEPPADTVFVLTTSSASQLLPTIVSRTQTLQVRAVPLSALPSQDQASVIAWQLSQGAPGMLQVLLTDENDELKLAVDQAKAFLRMNEYERLVELDGLSKDKDQLNLLLMGLGRVIQALYRAAAAKNSQRQVAKLLKAMQEVASAQESLELNVLSRLVVLRLAVNFNI